MSRPVLFALDDDAGVVRALHGDLGRRFGRDFRVLGESSAAAGLATLGQLAGHGEPVALLIVDHDMPEMPGLEFLARAHELHPSAKRVLLVERDYSARSPVVPAMTLGQADYYLSKPWMLEPDLYRGVSEFLAEWAKDQEAAFDLFHVVGALQTAARTSCASCSSGSTCRSASPPPTADQGAACSGTRAWTPRGCRS